MKKVFIKYNPYSLKTNITVDGKKLASNSKLGEKIADGSRLQDWVEELPHILVDEYNDNTFDILFHGTVMDYEDLADVFKEAADRGEVNVKLELKQAKETSDKEQLIDSVFQKIQQGPFDELRDPEIINAFENAKNSDFEVCVVATMSAGKSTLINSMLGEKLMPSKAEACTAIITRIKDTGENNWHAEVYNKNHQLIETHERLNYKTMENLNSNEDGKNVSLINISGNIPFVQSDDVSLVLIDTPGPNNSRDPEHKKVQSEFLSKSSKSLVLYIMEATFGSDDDNALLQRVADSMAVGGKQSKDRFIFVVNKMDNRKSEDGATEQTLNRVRKYLESHGISNPNLFPAAALPALGIRLIQNGAELDEDDLDETEFMVRKLNRKEDFHFEKYSSLPASVKGRIERQLKEAEQFKDANKQALIHTGIVSVEAAIRQYVQKYAKTAKIKNIVDTFMHKLEEVGCIEETAREIAKNQDESEKIVRQINTIGRKIDDMNAAKKFREVVDDAVETVNADSGEVIEETVEKFQGILTRRIDRLRGEELSAYDAAYECERLKRFAQELEPDFQVELQNLIDTNIVDTCKALAEEYKNKLVSLTEDISLGTFDIKIDPLNLMGGSIPSSDSSFINRFVQTKRVEDGEEWVKNTDRKWYKPWTWFQEKGYYRTKYKDVKYVDAEKMAQDFLTPIEDGLWENGNLAKEFALEQSKKIGKEFNKEFKKLDSVLKEKLEDLKTAATDKEAAEERIKEAEIKLNWLREIQREVESILDI